MTANPVLTEPSPPHRNCAQLMVPGLGDDTLSRFVLHLDDQPRLMSAEEIARDLQDPFATRLLGVGVFPNTAREVLQALADADPGGPLSRQLFFLLGEGGQASPTALVNRNLRFLITCGTQRAQDGPDVFVSSFHPDQGMVELAAWDASMGGFNFYRTMPESNAWVFAGNSRHALSAPTAGNGPFESHVSGHLLMKELKTPWVNWHSPFARIPAVALADQGLQNHPWVSRLEPGGAYTLEDDGARPAIRRWNGARVAAIVAGTSTESPVRVLRQVTGTMTVNLVSSSTSSAAAVGGSASAVDLPGTFFADADLLGVVGLPEPPRLAVAADVYRQVLTALDVRLTDGGSFDQSGDTHFAFVVPERAHEDVDMVDQSLQAGLLTRRLVACLAMVDFPNPVFSPRRAALQAHIDQVTWTGDGPAFSEAVAAAINGSAAAGQAGTPEAEFAALWTVGDGFAADFGARLDAYFTAVGARLGSVAGFTDCYLVAESRRALVRQMPIFESPLLFSTSSVPDEQRRMTETATVEEVAS